MRKLTLATTLATVVLASTGLASLAQDATAPGNGGMAGMQDMAGMGDMSGMQGKSGSGAMQMDNMGMMPMMMAMMPMMMPMGGGSMAGKSGVSAMAQGGNQAALDTKLNLLISSIETLTARIDALEAKTAN